MASKTLLEIIVGLKDQTSGVLRNIAGNVKSFGDGVKKAFHSEPVRLFRNAVAAVSAAIVGSVVEAAKFNIEIARVWTMAGGGIATFKELREQARGLASDFGLARSEIAGGMYNALSAGVDKNNLKSFMATAAKVAVADGSNISVAVDGITTVLNAFKVKVTETDAVTDKLFQTVAMGKTTFGALSANLATVAPIAAASDIPLEQILAHVATLTAQGTPTAQAMTQIRASIMGLNQALGDGWSKQMSYQSALKQVWQQAGYSQTGLLKLVGSSEAVQAVLGGIGKNAAMATEKLNGMGKASGAADAAFKKVDQFRHWPHLLETARGAVSKFGEEVDRRVAPYVDKVTAALKKWTTDKQVWSGISSFLDAAEKRLVKIAGDWRELFTAIESPEDIGVALQGLGEMVIGWFKDAVWFVISKAPDIGDMIGRAIKAGIMSGTQDWADRQVAKQQLKQRGQWEGYNGQAYLPEQVKAVDSRNEAKLDQFVDETRRAALEARGAEAANRIIGAPREIKTLDDVTQTVKTAQTDRHQVPSAIKNAGSDELQKTEKELTYLESQAKSMGDMAAQLADGKAREAALALQQEYAARAEEQKQILKLQQDAVKLFQDQAAAQGDFNAAVARSIARLNSQVAAMRN